MSECKRELTYTCWNDCLQGGCPGHKATVNFRSGINTYEFDINSKKIYLEPSEMQAIIDLIKALNRCDTVKF